MPECIWSEDVIGIQFRPLRFSKAKRRILLQSAGHASIEALNAIAQYQHLAKVIGLFDIFALSSLSEQFPIPVVEAMADRFPNVPIVIDHLFMPVVTDPDFGIVSKFDGFASRSNIYVKWTSLIMDVIREQGVRWSRCCAGRSTSTARTR